jgi:hypothetical protein
MIAEDAAREFVGVEYLCFYGEMGAFGVVMVMCRIAVTTFELVYDCKRTRQ